MMTGGIRIGLNAEEETEVIVPIEVKVRRDSAWRPFENS